MSKAIERFLDAATVLGWLRDPDLLARVSEGVLDDESVRLLAKSWGPEVEGSALSVDDVALLDELRYLIGDPPIVNTGNKGAAEKQPGDWLCGKCNYHNWRRRKVCQTCFPCPSLSVFDPLDVR